MIMTGSGEARTARDGRRWTLRPARPTDGRALARLFADVRSRGPLADHRARRRQRAVGGFWISEMIRAAEHLVLVAEADGEVVGNILVSVDRGVATEHIGVLSHHDRRRLARRRHRHRAGRRRPALGASSAACASSRWASSRRTSARSPSTRSAGSSARASGACQYRSGDALPRRGADGLVPRSRQRWRSLTDDAPRHRPARRAPTDTTRLASSRSGATDGRPTSSTSRATTTRARSATS